MGAHRDTEEERQQSFRFSARARQAPPGEKHNPNLLALGCEEENLYPSLRGRDGADGFFGARGIQWWRTERGDRPSGSGPTRHTLSSQVSCVNFLLPLAAVPGGLAAALRAVDADVLSVVPVDYSRSTLYTSSHFSSPVEFEWVGLTESLEGGPGMRGANTTSADAFIVAETASGRRGYLIEWKYVEDGAEKPRDGDGAETRRRRYSERFRRLYKPDVRLDDFLIEPVYQLMRLTLLADLVRERGEFGVTETKALLICPTTNTDFRNLRLRGVLKKGFPEAETVAQVMDRTLLDPTRFVVTDQKTLATAVPATQSDEARRWRRYMAQRYGW